MMITITTRNFYSIGSQRLATRLNAELYYLVGDHLGSTSLSYKEGGSDTKTQLYRAWGENRHPTDSTLPTTMRYTGQRETSLGIYFYGARWYDHYLATTVITFIMANPVEWQDGARSNRPFTWGNSRYPDRNTGKMIPNWPDEEKIRDFERSASGWGIVSPGEHGIFYHWGVTWGLFTVDQANYWRSKP
jgi:hypothetical protein